jgi:hypothetical protein
VDPVPVKLLDQVLDRALREEALVARVAAHAASGATTSWRAAAWLLERRHPERWGDPRVRARDVEPVVDPGSPFAEVDELAKKRRARLGR